MATNSRGLIEALDISDTDGECMSDEWEDPEGDKSDDTENEISVISTSSTPGTSASSISGVPSLLEVLKAPKPAEVSRKRKTYCNTRSGKRRKTRGSSSSASEPKSVQPQQRLKRYPNEQLDISAGKLFCKACREELSLKSSSLANHIKSVKHQEGKRRLARKEVRERDIAKHLSAYNEQNHLIGENLPEETQVFRVKVVTAFLRAAVPLNKMEHFREIFEESAYRLTDRRHMFDLVPFIQKQELAKLRKEIDGKEVSVIFDGTTYLGEALAIVIRYVTNDWVIQQKLVRLQILTKSLNGEEVARELISVLSVSYGIPSYSLLAAMRDRASVNEVAIKTLKIVYPNLVSVGCFSHTIDHVGEKFCTPTLTEFIISWTSLFSHSPKGRMLWKEQTGRSMGNFSATRWWSRWEIMDQILVQFGDIEAFLRKEDVGSNATHLKLLGFLTDVEKKAKLQLELAAVIDWGHPFVKATYRLEGDGPMAVDCYETIKTVRAAIRSSHTPNVQAIIQKISSSSDSTLLHNVFRVSPKVHSRDARGKAGSSNSGGSLQQEMLQHAKACVQPGLDYFEKHLSSSLKDVLLAFKAARFFSPQKMRDIQPDADAIDTLKTFPFLNFTN